MRDVAPLYPPAPAGVPANLAKPGLRYRLQAVLVLLSLALFLLVHLALLAGALALMAWVVWPAGESAALPPATTATRLGLVALHVSAFAVGAMLFAFLVKGFFKRGGDDISGYLEVRESEQPELFGFIRSLCREIGAPMPAHVYLSHDVNAAVFYSTSILSLIVPPPKKLLIGLGLINGLDLVEFTALLAHEMGHFSQRTLRLGGYVMVANRAITNMVFTRDRWDRWVARGATLPWVSAFALPLFALAELARGVLKAVFRWLNVAHLSLSRQMEFNADLVAVSVAGSDAPIDVLLKSDFCQACMEQAGQGLALAAEQRLFTRDLFFHQQRAGELLRTAAGNPDLGRPPKPPADPAVPATVFQPGATDAAAMWADHPLHYDRERNAKRRYFRSPQDDRPAALLLRDEPAVREELTRQFYRTGLDIEPDEPLAEPEHVEAFLEEERSAGKFDPRYHGIYDNRYLELADPDELLRDAAATASPSPEGLAAALAALYPENLQAQVAERRRRWEEFELLDGISSGRRRPDGDEIEFRGQHHFVSDAATLRETVQTELEEDRRRLAEFDRSVFTLHDQLAEGLGKRDEFRQRYRFHLALQRLHQVAWDQKGQLEAVLQFVHSHKGMELGDVVRVEDALDQVRARLGWFFQQAGELILPDLKHLPAGVSVASLLPAESSFPDLSSAVTELSINTGRLAAAHRHWAAVVDKLNRVQVKSLRGILDLQEQLARVWGDAHPPAPVAAGPGSGML